MIQEALTFDWDAPISDAERDALLQRLAGSVRKRGLQTATVWMLEIHRPLFPLGGQMAIMFSPFLAVFFGGGAFDLQKYTKLMQDKGNIDRLIELLDGDSVQSDQDGAKADP